MNVLTVICIIGLSFIGTVSCQCDAGFTPADGYCFYISETSATWYEAKVNCVQDIGGQLAVIDTQSKSDSLTTFLTQNLNDAQSAWIGATNMGLPGNDYVWDATCMPMTYKNWDLTPSESDQCVYVKGSDFKWGTAGNADIDTLYICEPSSCD